MAHATCSIDDCERPVCARGLCKAHYSAWSRKNPDAPRHKYTSGASKAKGRSLEDRFWSKVDSTDPLGCWTWTGALDVQSGYGRIQVDGVTDYAHRVSYSLSIGDLDPLLTIDHLCRNRSCVNPLHLEQVTHRENIRRVPRVAVTHCPQGHPYEGENVRVNRGSRVCVTCNRERCKAWRENRAA